MARGGRKDQPIDRSQGPTAEFVDDLRRLRGGVSLQEIGRRMGYHSSTVSRRLNPAELPAWRFVESYVTACGPRAGRGRNVGACSAGLAPKIKDARRRRRRAHEGQGGGSSSPPVRGVC
ncbi:helix-turn-helix domain-containing protein [Actinomadura sp. ATCC 39365]